jgi:hypothetical protein
MGMALTACLFAICGCQTAPVSGVEGGTTTVQDREVVGRAEFFVDGAPVRVGLFSSVSAAAFVVVPPGSDRGTLLEVSGDGSLHWRLAPATYDLVALRVARGDGIAVAPINGKLTVAAERPTTDVGVIRVERGTFGTRVRQIQPSSAASTGSPDLSDPAQPLQLRPLKIGAFADIVDICAPRWWLQCTREVKGVTAVEPTVEVDLRGPRVAQANGLQPRFVWHGPPGAVYDLVVWRGIQYKPNALAAAQYVPGPVVHYVEGLDRSEFAAIPPLQPMSRYFWSVRIRQGETVSTWSTTGHFTFLLIAMSSSSGQLFSFETR